ncbi:MAG TPA: DUF58 domain-containing protein [Verrucomicrobiae bacterium]|nr:DUF58 domain-containing protein [Verrucomicrobiae bacterium]
MKWILGTLALLVLGLVLKLSFLVYAMYVLLGILLLSRFFTRTWTENLEVARHADGEIFEIGNSINIVVQVQNRGSLTIPWLIIEDSLPLAAMTGRAQRIKIEGARLELVRLKPGETATLEYGIEFLTRGYYQLGPVLLETGDVFGLHRRFRVASEPHFALVLPKVLSLDGYNLASRRPQGEIRVVHRLFEDPTRLAGVRPYQMGDPLNRIHWRATARTQELHSRIYETSRVAGATFLLDFHTQSFQGPGGLSSAELAIVTVASLANAVYLMGQQVGFVSNGRDAADRIRAEGWRAEFLTRADAQNRAADPLENDRLRPVRVETRKGLEKMQQILETLARLEHTDGLEFPEMLATAISQIPRDATVVPVLRHVTPAVATALGEMVRRGFLVTAVVVAFDQDSVPDWAKPPEWAELLLAHGIDFRMVNSEESIMNLCAAAIVR